MINVPFKLFNFILFAAFCAYKKNRKQWFDIDVLSAQVRKKCVDLGKFPVTMNTDENLMVAVPDPDLEIGGVGGGSSRPLDKIGGAPPQIFGVSLV